MKTLARVVAEHTLTDADTWANERICTCGESVRILPNNYPTHVAAAYRTERTVIDADALSHLPTGAIARSRSGDTWLHYPNGWDNLSEDGAAGSYNDSVLELPVYVLYLPGDEA